MNPRSIRGSVVTSETQAGGMQVGKDGGQRVDKYS